MPRKPKKAVVRRRVGAARRCLQVLEVLASEPYLFTLADIAETLSLPKSSLYRLLSLLSDAGYIEEEPATKRYSLSAKVLWIGSSYLRGSPVQRCAHSALIQLSNATGAMSHLGVWDSGTVLILHTADPPNAASLFVEVGERRPLHATALGKALLAWRPAEDVKRLCEAGLPAFTPRTITTPEALEEELERVRQMGAAIDNEEYALGLRCVAAPVRNQSGVVAAMGISGDLNLITDEALPRLTKQVRDMALQVSAQLGFRPLSAQYGSLLYGSTKVAREPEARPEPADKVTDPAELHVLAKG